MGEYGAIQKIEVGPVPGGWRLSCPLSDLVLVYLSGARAERQAYQLAETLVAHGHTVEVIIRDRRDVVVGSAIARPQSHSRPMKAVGVWSA